jgi:hypothetical protein
VYAFTFFCITTALFCNKRVKYKYLEIGELIFAVALFISTLVAASLVTSGVSKSCTYYTSDAFCNAYCRDERSGPSCPETFRYILNTYDDDDSEAKNFADVMQWMFILRDAVWVASAAFLLMAIILFIRYRTVHRGGRQPPNTEKKYKQFDGAEGESTTEDGNLNPFETPASPLLEGNPNVGYDTQGSRVDPATEEAGFNAFGGNNL